MSDTAWPDYTSETIKRILPPRIVVDEKGVYWRDYGSYWSLCPHSSPPEGSQVVAVFELGEYRDQALAEGRRADDLEAENKRLREALAFYAEQRHIHVEWSSETQVRDRGQVAQAALAAVPEERG